MKLCFALVFYFLGVVYSNPSDACTGNRKCVARSDCDVDLRGQRSCRQDIPDFVCCPMNKVISNRARRAVITQDGYRPQDRYRPLKSHSSYRPSHDKYQSSHNRPYGVDKYQHQSHGRRPDYMDFYHEDYDRYFGYKLSKQAKEILRNYRAKEECGLRNKSPADMARISSGYLHETGFTSFGEFRWHVALLIKQRSYQYRSSTPVYKYHCGATLIHRSLLITAAHCVQGINPKKMLAHLGDWNILDSAGELFPAIKRKILRVFIHSGYNPATYLNDIALLQMYDSIDTYKTPHIGPVCLPEVNYELKDHSKCFIVGWGDDTYKQNFGSNILKSVSVTYATDKECTNRLYASLKHVDDKFVLDTDSQKCVIGAYGKDACVGDGGGGVVCPLSNDEGPDVCNTPNCASEHYFLFGIISYGSPVCGEDSVTIITDIVENLNWIQTVLEPAGGFNNFNNHNFPGRPHTFGGRAADVNTTEYE